MQVLAFVILCLIGSTFSQSLYDYPLNSDNTLDPQQFPGVSPVANCLVQKKERWVVFWGYHAVDNTKTINYGDNNQFEVGYTEDGNVKTFYNSSSEFGQPTTFVSGTHFMIAKTSYPFFLYPRGSATTGRPYLYIQWHLDSKSVTVNKLESFGCPSEALLQVYRANVTDANATASELQQNALTYLRTLYPAGNVTDDRITVYYNTTTYGEGVYMFTIRAWDSNEALPNDTELADRWRNYPTDHWPEEFQSPDKQELIFDLVNSNQFLSDYQSSAYPLPYIPYLLRPRTPRTDPGIAPPSQNTGTVTGSSSGNAGGTSGNSAPGITIPMLFLAMCTIALFVLH